MSIAVRELKAGLPRVLLRAQAGEVIEVTSHNRPIARIVGIPAQAGDGGLRSVTGCRCVPRAFGCSPPRLSPPTRRTSRRRRPS